LLSAPPTATPLAPPCSLRLFAVGYRGPCWRDLSNSALALRREERASSDQCRLGSGTCSAQTFLWSVPTKHSVLALQYSEAAVRAHYQQTASITTLWNRSKLGLDPPAATRGALRSAETRAGVPLDATILRCSVPIATTQLLDTADLLDL
jgi:hypothetical protein